MKTPIGALSATMLLVTLCVAQPTTTPSTAPAAGDSPEIKEGMAILRELETLLRAKNGDGVRKLVLIGKFPDSRERLDGLVKAVEQGQLADARVVPLESKMDGPVMCIIGAFTDSAGAANPDIEPSIFIQRDGRWRLISDAPAGAKTIMNNEERAATDRLTAWVDNWRRDNREKVKEQIRKSIRQ